MKHQKKPLQKRQRGIATLASVALLMFTSTLTGMFFAKTTATEQKLYSQQHLSHEALESAQAGLDYGIVHLNKFHSAIILDTNNDGKVDAYTHLKTQNVQLPNGARYTITYSNPVTDDLNIIRIKSIGTSKDGKITHTVEQLVKFHSALVNPPSPAVVAKGKVTVTGNSTISNQHLPITIYSGDKVDIKGNGSVQNGKANGNDNGNGNSNGNGKGKGKSKGNGNGNSGIQENQTSLKQASDTAIFNDVFHASKSEIKNERTGNIITSQLNKSLDGVKAGIFWVDSGKGTATISGTTHIGTLQEPVILIVDGKLKIAGVARIYGFIYATGDITTTGSSNIYGGLVTEGNLSSQGNSLIEYNPTVYDKIRSTIGSFIKIPGSWRDW